MTSTNAPDQCPYCYEPCCGCDPDASQANAGDSYEAYLQAIRREHALFFGGEHADLYGTRAIPDHGQPVHDRCGQPLRWSAAYDEPHWVHTSAAAVVACPPMRGAL